jgi:hypothetical protein
MRGSVGAVGEVVQGMDYTLDNPSNLLRSNSDQLGERQIAQAAPQPRRGFPGCSGPDWRASIVQTGLRGEDLDEEIVQTGTRSGMSALRPDRPLYRARLQPPRQSNARTLGATSRTYLLPAVGRLGRRPAGVTVPHRQVPPREHLADYRIDSRTLWIDHASL